MKTAILVAALFSVPFTAVHAADSGARTYADPACSSRTANPENCVLQDGPPRAGTIAVKQPVQPVVPATPDTGASFTRPPTTSTTTSTTSTTTATTTTSTTQSGASLGRAK